MSKMRRRKRTRALAWLILALSLCAMGIFGVRYWEIQQIYREGDESYKQLADRVRPEGAHALEAMNAHQTGGESDEQPADGARADGSAGNGSHEQPTDVARAGGSTGNGNHEQPTDGARGGGSAAGNGNNGQPTDGRTPGGSFTSQTPGPGGHLRVAVEVPDMNIDFAALTAVNPDVAAWLYCPNTAIDYPVVLAKDYDYYLHHLPDGTANANGTLFIDYNWTDFGDELTVIYGHNMKSGRMFGSLTKYKEQSYFKAHPFFYLYTAGGEKYRIDLLYGCVIGAGQWRERAFMFKENVDALLAYAAHNTTFQSEAKYEKGGKVVVLSTCSYEFNDARYVVIGVLR